MANPHSLEQVRSRIVEAARACGRDPAAISLLAVSKTHPAASVSRLLAQGQTQFGENRVQEALPKFAALRETEPGLRLHLIGPLQTNKALEAVRGFDVIESLDRPRLADALERAAARAGRLPDLLVQVNIGDEPQKAGIARGEAAAFIRDCRARFGAGLRGLMCIPPQGQPPTPFFEALALLAREAGLGTLSMGMSEDFDVAIAAGATEVRVGSALFGSREPPSASGAPLASPS